MPTIRQITALIEELAPLQLQESYDNAGMQVGDDSLPATGALLCVDVTEEVVDEVLELMSVLNERRILSVGEHERGLLLGGLIARRSLVGVADRGLIVCSLICAHRAVVARRKRAAEHTGAKQNGCQDHQHKHGKY